MDNEQNKPITVFISYSWDSEEHKAWVKMLADRLTEEGLEVLLDQYEIAGNSLTSFMQDGIAKADKVIIVGTPRYKEKANSHKSGTNIEDQIINIHMGRDFTNPKFIPVLRKGGFADSFTVMVSDRFGFDFTDDAKFESEFERLVGGLYGNTHRPGKKDDIQWSIILQGEQIQGTYFGPLKDGKPEGIGHFIGKNGDDYQGTFKEGECCGNGKLVCIDGNVFEGEFSNGSSVNGIKTTVEGIIECGEFKNGLLNGKGKRTYPNGRVEEGTFLNGKPYGQGKIIMTNGAIEEGKFENGIFIGQSIIIYPNGDILETVFENGWLTDQAKMTRANGDIEEGSLSIAGYLFGQGKIIRVSGIIEIGHFYNSVLSGTGKRTYPDGRVEEGVFWKGELLGEGKITYPDGRVEEGGFVNGRLIK